MSQVTLNTISNGDAGDATPVMANFNALKNRINLGMESDNIAANAVNGSHILLGAYIFKQAKGADVASASSVTLGNDGNFFDITGTTNITSITAKSAGTVVTLQFDGALTVVDGSNLSLASSFITAAGSTLTLVSDGTNWLEVSRSPLISVAPQYRAELLVAQASTTTMTVSPGVLDVNGTVTKTAATTLTLSTAGDWAGGSSLRATSAYGYVGMDASGNIKMHTTAPTHSDYAVSSTAGTKRYATWSSTVYRIIGYFRMNATGSGELDTFGVSNLKDGNVSNALSRWGTTQDTVDDTSYGTDLTEMVLYVYSTGRPFMVQWYVGATTGTFLNNDFTTILDIDGSDQTDSEALIQSSAGTAAASSTVSQPYMVTLSQGVHTLTIQAKVSGSSDQPNRKRLTAYEL